MSRFLDAVARRPVDCTPVWFMRQAGRYMPVYRALREKYSLLELCRTPELACQVTLQPLERFSLDAGIIFADILLPLAPMGVPFEFAKGEGPVILAPVRTAADVDRLQTEGVAEQLSFVLDAIGLVTRALHGRVPLIGFGGGPFTLASYLIEGGGSRHYQRTKALMYGEPAVWHKLMQKLARVEGDFLRAQAQAGAAVVQVFDSWVGCLSPADYREFVLPHMQGLFARLQGVPTIHFGTGTSELLGLMREAGGDVIGLDWRIDLDVGWQRLGPTVGVQGNLDPLVLFAPPTFIEQRVQDVLQRAGGRPGHIFNLGHGILPETPEEHVQVAIDAVHRLSARPTPARMTHVVVIGGGIAGLSTALALREGGYQGLLTVLERERRWGGKIRTEQIGAYRLEGGPESMLTMKPWGLQLAQRLGLDSRLINTRADNSGVFIWSKQRLERVPDGFTLMVPTRIVPLLKTGLISPWGKLRMAMDWFIPPRRLTTDESIGAFVRRRLGREALEQIAEPMMAGIYAGRADDLSIQCTFPRFVDMERQYGSLVRAALAARKAPQTLPGRSAFVSFQNGLQELVDALQHRLTDSGVTLQSGSPATAVESGRVTLKNGEVLTCDAVVLAVPAFAAADLVRGLDGELAHHLALLRYQTSATVTLAWPAERVRHSLKGFGVVVPQRERRAMLACTWTSSKWAHRAPAGMAMLRAYVADSEVVAESDTRLVDLVKSELTVMLGTPIDRPDLQEVRRIEQGTPHYRVGHLDWVTTAERMAARHANLFLTGSAYRGIGIPDCIREGERTAAEVLAALSRSAAERST